MDESHEVERIGPYALLEPVFDDGFAVSSAARVCGPNVGPRIVQLTSTSQPFTHEVELRAAFLAEGRAARRVRHRRFLAPRDTLVGEGMLCFATEYVQGVRLAELMGRARATGAALSLELAGRIVLDVLSGVSAVHAATPPGGGRFLVHGDICPANVLVSYRGESRLVHSGLSTASSRIGVVTSHNPRLAYKAPEQLRTGIHAVPIGPSADLFAVGVMLWEMLAGSRLFDDPSDVETVERVLGADVPDICTVCSPALPDEVVAMLCLALGRGEDRPTTSAADFGDALESALGARIATEEDVSALVDEFLGEVLEERRQRLEEHASRFDAHAEDERARGPVPSWIVPLAAFSTPPPDSKADLASGRVRGPTPWSSLERPPRSVPPSSADPIRSTPPTTRSPVILGEDVRGPPSRPSRRSIWVTGGVATAVLAAMALLRLMPSGPPVGGLERLQDGEPGLAESYPPTVVPAFAEGDSAVGDASVSSASTSSAAGGRPSASIPPSADGPPKRAPSLSSGAP